MSEQHFANPPVSPFEWLKEWIEAAAELPLHEPMAMNLATVDDQHKPCSRIVLFKGFDQQRICFYTNYSSRKGQQLAHNQDAALCLWWDPMMRQVRIEGRVEKLSAEQSDAYFASRDRGSQIGAWASHQSQPIADRASLEKAFGEAEQRFANGPVPRPPHWGGYGLVMDRIEFWQGRDNRYHDRVIYERTADDWHHQRLQP